MFQYHLKVIHNIREAVHKSHSPSPVAIALELAGQGIRLGTFLPVSGMACSNHHDGDDDDNDDDDRKK